MSQGKTEVIDLNAGDENPKFTDLFSVVQFVYRGSDSLVILAKRNEDNNICLLKVLSQSLSLILPSRYIKSPRTMMVLMTISLMKS